MKIALKVVITLVLLSILIWTVGGLQKIWRILSGMNVIFVLFVLLLNTADRVLMTYKWLRLLRSKNIWIPLFQGMKTYCASIIWGMCMPSTVGADAIRIFRVSQKGHDTTEIFASVVIERLVGFFSALILGIAGFILISKFTALAPQFKILFWLGCITLLFTVIVFVMSFAQGTFDTVHNKFVWRFKNTKIIQKLRLFHINYREYRNNKIELLIFFGLTFLEQLFPIITVWVIAKGLDVDVGLFFVAGALPLTMLVSRLPISIDGLGVFESVFALLMSLAGVSIAEAIAIAFSGRVLQIVSLFPWWIVETFENRSLKPLKPAVEGN